MNERILLSTYVIKILDVNKNEQALSIFNGTDDFTDVFEAFCDNIFANINNQSSSDESSQIHLTIDKKATRKDRSIYGHFSSGVSGENYDIRNLGTGETEFEVDPDAHGSFRDVFFYFRVIPRKKIGYLVLQRKSKFGVKIALKKALNSFILAQGYQQYRVHINNLLHHKVYKKMLENGKLKKVDLIRRRIPDSIDDYYSNDRNTDNVKGTLTTTIASSKGLSEKWKDFASGLMRKYVQENTRVEIDHGEEEFDEVDFELEFQGKKKKFYIINKSRTQPDVDVTSSIKFKNRKPTIESLVTEAESLIDDMLEITPNV